MPSGRWKGACALGTRVGRWSDSAAVFGAALTLGNPGGWSRPVSRATTATGELAAGADGFQGNTFSSKYTSEECTTRGMLGIYTLYAPGVVRLRPRLMPTHARGSIRVFE
eukprot:6211939-Pleurochrysis_carterae.AAC.2